jgi:predicted nucleotidyltransferase
LERSASGRFVLRVSSELHARLRQEARAKGLSLNQYCLQCLRSRVTLVSSARAGSSLDPGLVALVERLVSSFGPELAGVVLYGSWTRGEASDTSDVDLAVVLDAATPLRRELYRSWESTPIAWEGRPVEVNFVHLPGDGELPNGFWGELALDGIVLLDPNLEISRRLVRFRRDIVAGRVVRHVAHGQAYWVKTEVA